MINTTRPGLLRPARTAIRTVYAGPPRPKIVVIGCGWAGFRFAQDIDKHKYDVSLISPRNHFLFTPLLPSTAVGTLEFRCIQEPVRTIPGLDYKQATCNEIDYKNKKLHCAEVFKNANFTVDYDYLILAPGSETNTFNVPGVDGNPRVFFLKQLDQARSIRNKLIESFERASMPSVSREERARLLTFVVVGGGPTNVEFASELHDFLMSDVARSYGDLLPYVRVVVVEASGHILGTFNAKLVDYVEKLFQSRRIDVRANTTVKAVEDGHVAVLGDGTRLPFGLMVWSTGIRQVKLIRDIAADIAHAKGGRLVVDNHLRLLAAAPPAAQSSPPTSSADTAAAAHAATVAGPNANTTSTEYGPPLANGTVFAMGDCACDSVRPLPALAQVAAQQGKYLAKMFNTNSQLFPRNSCTDVTTSGDCAQAGANNSLLDQVPPFKYTHLGSMASVGEWKGVIDTPNNSEHEEGRPVKGFLAFLLWRAAYWTKQVSWVNRMLIPMYWFKSMLFGRDISRF